MFEIPLFDLNFDACEEKAALDVIKSRWISTGPKCLEFENNFAKALDAKYAITTSNCTTALHMALEILNIGPDDEVIVPSLTFVATVNAIKYTGALPVFADISSLSDLTISPIDIEKKITSKTKAILVMHFAGFPCDMNSINIIAKKYSLKVIEDTAHAPLSEYCGKKLGTLGDIGCFSFFSNKNISCGEGGMIVTNNKDYYEHAKLIRSHGMTTMSYQRAQGHATKYDVVRLGYNYRMDDIHAAIGNQQLLKLELDLKKRVERRNSYIKLLSDNNKIIIPFEDNKEFVSNYIFPVILKNSTVEYRDLIRQKLEIKGIQTSVHYPSVHKFSIYNNGTILPNTEYCSDNEITLPMYSGLTSEKIKYIVDILLHSL